MFIGAKSQTATFKSFDKLTQIRLINSIVVTLFLTEITPLIYALKGTYLPVAIISVIMILNSFAVKTNKWIVENVSIVTMYKLSMGYQALFIGTLGFYFIDKEIFVYVESAIFIVEVALFSAFSIMLTDIMVKRSPSQVTLFNVFRNSVIADATVLGLSIAIIFDLFFEQYAIVMFTMVVCSLYLVWLYNTYDTFKKETENVS